MANLRIVPGMGVQIKICGITNIADATAAADFGADALGFMFYAGSPRRISYSTAASIAQELPPSIKRVGVFVDPGADEVLQAVEEAGVNMLQFHGNETPEFCAKFDLPVIKAFRVQNESSFHQMSNFKTDWLLDTYVQDQPGGTGATFSWALARRAKALGGRFFLAGGLTPQNVTEAISLVRPYGVDVSSGVEFAAGLKDRKKLRDFIAAARSVPDETQ